MYITYVKGQRQTKVVQEFIDFMSECITTDEYKHMHEEHYPWLKQ